MAELKKFRLINLDGVGKLSCQLGIFALEQIDENVAAHLFSVGSRYVEKVKFEETTEPPISEPIKKQGRLAVKSKKV